MHRPLAQLGVLELDRHRALPDCIVRDRRVTDESPVDLDVSPGNGVDGQISDSLALGVRSNFGCCLACSRIERFGFLAPLTR